jgi:7-cyano-7-deazaguanine synthase in queuosine biosynthesis
MTTFHFYRGDTPQVPLGTLLKLDGDVITGRKSVEENFGEISSLELDLLAIASSIFAADRGQQRGERERFARTLELHIPIVNTGRLVGLVPIIEKTLRRLSNDTWQINLYQCPGTISDPKAGKHTAGKVLLFSGGLDSLAAAVEFSHSADSLALVSHHTMNRQTTTAQSTLYQMLLKKGCKLTHHSFFVSARDKGSFEHAIENSQRTRSFLFLTLAAITANRLGRREIVVIAENGQMAIHLPLNSARMAAFSTHTAHPDVLAEMQRYLRGAFGIDFVIQNPYVLKTKKEVIEPIVKNAPETIPHSNSCWKNSRVKKGATHCGECIPCFIRRIAIESYQPDKTAYGRDVFKLKFGSLQPADEGRRNLADLAELTLKFEKMSNSELYDEWPELFSENIDAPATIEMYRRAAAETRAVLSKYSASAQVLT